MFRKISWELTFTYILVILFSVGILGVYLLGYLDEYFLRNMQSELFTQAYTIAEAWPRSIDLSGLSRRETNFYRGVMIRMSNQTGSRIIILTDRGAPVWYWPESSKPEPGIAILPEVKLALEGKPAGGGGMDYLSQAYPIREIGEGGGRIAGVVYVTRSKTYLQSILIELRNRFLTGFIISLALSLILSVIFSHYITRPIVEITRVAEDMEKGDLNRRAKVTTRNEIGALSGRFNLMAEKLQGTLVALMGEKNKLASIIEHMSGGVLVVDTTGEIIMTNRTALKLLGLRDNDITGKNIVRVIPGHSLLQLIEDAGYKRRIHGQLEEMPSERTVNAHVNPLFSENDQSLGAVVILNDITEFRLLDQMRTEFVSNVSHELRTPLASIKGLAELLIDGALKDEDRAMEFLESINREVDRLTRLVKDLLDLSKMESGMVKMEKHPVNMEELINLVLGRLTPQADRKKINITANLTSGVYSYANMDRVQQVLINLIDNALRYTPEGEKIVVKLSVREKNCLVEVSDTGPGISPEDMERVFERFYRADKARTRHAGGFGLGLAIARQIIENLNGTIGVHGNTPRGTTFYFTIPLLTSYEEGRGYTSMEIDVRKAAE
jgi:two-component system phosphate regulon sensor histidine kinase PhoR